MEFIHFNSLLPSALHSRMDAWLASNIYKQSQIMWHFSCKEHASKYLTCDVFPSFCIWYKFHSSESVGYWYISHIYDQRSELKLLSELESDLQDNVDWKRK